MNGCNHATSLKLLNHLLLLIFPSCLRLVHSLFENNDNDDGTNNFCIEPLMFIRGNEVIGAWNIFKF